MKRLLPLATFCLVLGCAPFTRDPGPDGKYGTADDGKSKAEEVVDTGAGVAAGLGYGWIGIAAQGVTSVLSGIATARAGKK